MNKNQLKSEILEYIKAHAGTSFVEIERVFEENNFDYKGDGAYTSGQHPNVVFWIGWNQEAFDVIAELKKDRRIEMDICEPIVYMVDGKGLDLPIVSSKTLKQIIGYLSRLLLVRKKRSVSNMNDKEKIYNQLHHDAPIQIIPAPENLFVEYIEADEVWYSPVVCMALSKAHNINFYDSDDVGCIDKAATCSIKNLILRQVSLNNSAKWLKRR